MNTLYVIGRLDQENDTLYLPAQSLVILFSVQAACRTSPVELIVILNEEYFLQQLSQYTNSAGELRPVEFDKSDLIEDSVTKEQRHHYVVNNYEDSGKQSDTKVSGESVLQNENDRNLFEKDKILGSNNNSKSNNDNKISASFAQNGTLSGTAGEASQGQIRLHRNSFAGCSSYLFPVPVSKLIFSVQQQRMSECPSMVQATALPAVYCETNKWCVAGMCASLRAILLAAHDLHEDVAAKKLLGFRDGCLHSCSEVSCWTKFCEVEMPSALQDVFDKYYLNESIDQDWVYPRTVLRYNNHMARPPILHNALKRKQQHIKKTVKDKVQRELLLSKKLCELPELDHDFAEGLDMTLADVMLYVCFDLIVHKLDFIDFQKHSPLVLKWLELISTNEGIIQAKPLLKMCQSQHIKVSLSNSITVTIPNVIDESLYKSDPERPKLHCTGSMTLQNDIDKVIKLLCSAGIDSIEYTEQSEVDDTSLPWSSYPAAVHPQEGELPPSRLLRKCQQVENIVNVVMQHCKPGNRIVDFCAGGGHVGIVLAYCLPECTVTFVENKASSLNKAKDRVKLLSLTNVEFYQCNMDYFRGNFDVGVCLHACGQASDIVLQKCYEQNASFVCSPCCYGSIQPNHSVQYPRSTTYQEVLTKLTDYLTLGHTADQTHGPEHPSTVQGQLCMRLIDGDRLSHAAELGYSTSLLLMRPVTCSPKNHILVGWRNTANS
uniref:Glutathione S-transferase C-terminal domain-containing protein homolog n=1 Tax=Hirondellea gigas TaxID=1518452 RepID=A0A2P2I8H2_9CRUS